MALGFEGSVGIHTHGADWTVFWSGSPGGDQIGEGDLAGSYKDCDGLGCISADGAIEDSQTCAAHHCLGGLVAYSTPFTVPEGRGRIGGQTNFGATANLSFGARGFSGIEGRVQVGSASFAVCDVTDLSRIDCAGLEPTAPVVGVSGSHAVARGPSGDGIGRAVVTLASIAPGHTYSIWVGLSDDVIAWARINGPPDWDDSYVSAGDIVGYLYY